MNKLHVWIPLFCMVCLIGSINSEPLYSSYSSSPNQTNTAQLDELQHSYTYADEFEQGIESYTLSEGDSYKNERKLRVYRVSVTLSEFAVRKKPTHAPEDL
ncbi:hypothetical protein [Alkalicoccobacillus murimartini]|uniref:Uncharacterized protein n=1 Tax=Alkalicoccobacillus murimartini TaxID=171685 RepID=A0ABT9YKY7_9BACI|nr:hypothetical protein [Alkalicoccobacillus murimartini]MDQ0208532.1 hypothetical protein [Alkalicoccobacillus murimartini]